MCPRDSCTRDSRTFSDFSRRTRRSSLNNLTKRHRSRRRSLTRRTTRLAPASTTALSLTASTRTQHSRASFTRCTPMVCTAIGRQQHNVKKGCLLLYTKCTVCTVLYIQTPNNECFLMQVWYSSPIRSLRSDSARACTSWALSASG